MTEEDIEKARSGVSQILTQLVEINGGDIVEPIEEDGVVCGELTITSERIVVDIHSTTSVQ